MYSNPGFARTAGRARVVICEIGHLARDDLAARHVETRGESLYCTCGIATGVLVIAFITYFNVS